MINFVVLNIVVIIVKIKLIFKYVICIYKFYKRLLKFILVYSVVVDDKYICIIDRKYILLGQIFRNMFDFKCIYLFICFFIYKCVNKFFFIFLILCILYLVSKNYEGVQNYFLCFFILYVLLKKVLNQLIFEIRVFLIFYIYFL